MRDVAEEMLRAHGREFTIRMQDGTEEVYLGHKVPSDQYVMFLPEAGVKAGDLIVDPSNPDEYFVTNVEPLIDEGRAVAAQAFYRIREQHEAAEATSRASSTTHMNHLERQYLLAANALTENTSSRVFNEDEITNFLDLDPNEPNYVERFSSLTKYHLDRGNLAPDSKTGLTGRRTLRVTAKGQDEARRLVDTPVTPDEFSDATAAGEAPMEIQESLQSFKQDYPDPARVAFIMMQFGKTPAHREIASAIKKTLAARGIEGVRADDKQYNDYLFPNILTYMHGCGLGVAVFEGLETDQTNPNVALEVGYLFAMRKPVCLLKDHKLRTLQSDLVGRLYNPFDPQNSAETIPPVVNKWLSDKGLGSS